MEGKKKVSMKITRSKNISCHFFSQITLTLTNLQGMEKLDQLRLVHGTNLDQKTLILPSL